MGPTTTEFSLDRIGQIAIPVHDLARAVRFYRDTLGMAFLFEVPGLAFFDCGGIRLMLSRPETPESARAASILYYKVADLDAAYDTLRARGVEFVDAPHLIARMDTHDLWMVFLRDSEGNTLGLMSERARGA
ncbi:MAG TPA: VOC family protein [Gemmatimonadaceae bacterium]|nr:VOC family protein [Gemmatimonadaceae bacterium]